MCFSYLIDEKAKAICKSEQRRLIKPANYGQSRRKKLVTEKSALVDELQIKLERVERLRKDLNYLNERVSKGLAIEVIELDDVAEYERALNSDEDSDSNDEESHNDFRDKLQVDTAFSGPYKYRIDVREIIENTFKFYKLILLLCLFTDFG